MNGKEREKFIRSDSEFRGFVVATLDGIKERFDTHLTSEMEELKTINIRLLKMENWKLKVTTVSGVIGTILGFILSKINI